MKLSGVFDLWIKANPSSSALAVLLAAAFYVGLHGIHVKSLAA